ncbi:MAG: hypothetical protein EOP84_31795, partial [Verrucomicrobiaceae bacterium]
MFRHAFLIILSLAALCFQVEELHASWPNEIQTILDQHCVKCHGPLEQEYGLELDTLEGTLKGSEDGPVIIPGKPDESVLITVLAPKEDPHMPPKKQLAEADIEKLRKWVASLPEKPAAAAPRPTIDPSSVPREPSAAIDYFLNAGWQQRGITPAPLCDDRTFVRRLYL